MSATTTIGRPSPTTLEVVDIADLKVTADPSVEFITYSLGSCIGVAIWDPRARVGGLLHYLLGKSALAPDQAGENPALFATSDQMNIGKRNYVALRRIFWRNSILIESEQVGGSVSRTMRLSVGTGRVTVGNRKMGQIEL